jgi:hypothetical protein
MTAIGRLNRLASFFEARLQATAIHSSQLTKEALLRDVAKKIKDIYTSRIATTKDNILQFLVNADDLFSKHLIEDMTSLASNVDRLIQEPTQDNLLLEMANVRRDILDNKQGVREALHNSVKIRRESDKNYREQLKSKFEQTLWRIEQTLIEQGNIVKEFCTPEVVELTKNILSGKVEPRRKELSKQQLLTFSLTHPAKKYEVDSLEILEQLLKLPAIKGKLTTVINAINRGHNPKDGVAVLEEARRIAHKIRMSKPTSVHEMPEDEAQEAFRAKLDPGEHWSDEMTKKKKELAEEPEEFPGMEPEKLEQEITNRDFLHQQSEQLRKRQQEEQQKKEWEEKMISKYNSASLYEFLRKV